MNDVLDLAADYGRFEVRDLILRPDSWKTFPLSSQLSWTAVPVRTTPAAGIPTTKGVYTFVVRPEIANHPHCAYLMYVGKAEGADGFRGRYGSYLRVRSEGELSNRPLVMKMMVNWFDHLWFCYAALTTDVVATEDALLRAYLPPINTDFPADISKAVRAFH